jgi:hypothetical protein
MRLFVGLEVALARTAICVVSEHVAGGRPQGASNNASRAGQSSAGITMAGWSTSRVQP